MKIIKQHWFSVLLIIFLAYILFVSQKQNAELVKQIETLEESNVLLEEQSSMYIIQIDSLENIDAEIIKDIRYIKIKENEAITAVDTMSISDLQGFFSERY